MIHERTDHRVVDGHAVELLAASALGDDGIVLNGLDGCRRADDDAGRRDVKAVAAAINQLVHRYRNPYRRTEGSQ